MTYDRLHQADRRGISRFRRAAAPPRLHPDPQLRHHGRQYRQWLAHRRQPAAADRAGRQAGAAPRRASGARSRWRISSSTTASRIAGPGEFVEFIRLPRRDPGRRFACYKISKRFDQDITACLGAFNLRLAQGRVADIRICYGGMAATPKRARQCETALIGRPWTLRDHRRRDRPRLRQRLHPHHRHAGEQGLSRSGGGEPAAQILRGDRGALEPRPGSWSRAHG